MLSLSLPSILTQLIWATVVAAASTSAGSSRVETLQFRITGESRVDSEICEGGRCMNVQNETWTFTVTPAGITAESETRFSGFDQDMDANACSIGGVYRGRHEVTHLNWSVAPSHWPERRRLPARLFHVKARTSDAAAGVETSGNCPQENYSHRPYDVLKEGLESASLDQWFLPLSRGSRTTRSVPVEEETVYSLEVLQGDLNDLARYETLRSYITPLTSKP